MKAKGFPIDEVLESLGWEPHDSLPDYLLCPRRYAPPPPKDLFHIPEGFAVKRNVLREWLRVPLEEVPREIALMDEGSDYDRNTKLVAFEYRLATEA